MNCPDCDAQLYGDLESCRCGWRKTPKAANEDELLPLIKRACAYCRKPSVASVNGRAACSEHFSAALYHEPVKSA